MHNHHHISTGVNLGNSNARSGGGGGIPPSAVEAHSAHHQHHLHHPHHMNGRNNHHHYYQANLNSESWRDHERYLTRQLNEEIRRSGNKSACRYRDQALVLNDLFLNIQRLAASNSRSAEQLNVINSSLIGPPTPPWGLPFNSSGLTTGSAQSRTNSGPGAKSSSSHTNRLAGIGSTTGAQPQPSSVKSLRSKIPIKHSTTLSHSGSSSLQYPSLNGAQQQNNNNNNNNSNSKNNNTSNGNNDSNNHNSTATTGLTSKQTPDIKNSINQLNDRQASSPFVSSNTDPSARVSVQNGTPSGQQQQQHYQHQGSSRACNGTNPSGNSIQCSVCLLKSVRLNLAQINKAVVAQNETIAKLKTKQLRDYFERQMTD